MQRYICIHGHFYQPPREDPRTGVVPDETSAAPYHNWNERICAECYEPNTAAKILDENGNVKETVNNYAKINFNVGPTLLSWMAKHAPEVYQKVLDADIESQKYFSGHGSAIAQPYNHVILPLANRRDKYTQILWGIRDFEFRFKRKPEGIWLPETAVDMETLDIASKMGIRFTILAPHQAKRVCSSKALTCVNVDASTLDPTMPYEVRIPSGRKMAVFFYDGPISSAVAFEKLLNNGEIFAERLISAFGKRKGAQLVHIATDGETFGHHHRFGEMALAYALKQLEKNKNVQLTNYSEYLTKHPPTHVAEIHENTSWSCMHGVERWRNDCGCRIGGNPLWNQAWRMPLRDALDWLRHTLIQEFDEMGRSLLKDPWLARNSYINIILDPSTDTIENFMQEHAARKLTESEKTKVLKLMDMQRNMMLMYTSCGWFFDDPSGLETIQILRYAAMSLQLFKELFKKDYEERFVQRLKTVRSNIRDERDARLIYRKYVHPAHDKW